MSLDRINNTRVGLVGGQRILSPFPSECSSFSRDFKTASCSSSYRAAVGTDLDLNVLCFRRAPPSSSFRSLAHSCSEDAPLGLPWISSTPSAWTRIFASWFNPVPLNSLKRKSPSCFHSGAHREGGVFYFSLKSTSDPIVFGCPEQPFYV